LNISGNRHCERFCEAIPSCDEEIASSGRAPSSQ
jgi:hypothetical protein